MTSTFFSYDIFQCYHFILHYVRATQNYLDHLNDTENYLCTLCEDFSENAVLLHNLFIKIRCHKNEHKAASLLTIPNLSIGL